MLNPCLFHLAKYMMHILERMMYHQAQTAWREYSHESRLENLQVKSSAASCPTLHAGCKLHILDVLRKVCLTTMRPHTMLAAQHRTCKAAEQALIVKIACSPYPHKAPLPTLSRRLLAPD